MGKRSKPHLDGISDRVHWSRKFSSTYLKFLSAIVRGNISDKNSGPFRLSNTRWALVLLQSEAEEG